MIVKQYGGYTIPDSLHLNGELTLGENIADLGGIAIAYDAFKMTKQGQGKDLIDGFTPDQRFSSGLLNHGVKNRDEIARMYVNVASAFSIEIPCARAIVELYAILWSFRRKRNQQNVPETRRQGQDLVNGKNLIIKSRILSGFYFNMSWFF